MKWFPKILKSKGIDTVDTVTPSESAVGAVETRIDERRITRQSMIEARIKMNRMYETVTGIDVFLSLPEVFFPINFIASRVSSAHFEIRKNSDDSIVWCANRSREAKEVSRLIARPNWLQPWEEFVYMHIVQKLATGNGFMRAAMNSDVFTPDSEKWKWCKNLWTIPSSMVHIDAVAGIGGLVNMFGCEEVDDVISGYTINGNMRVPSWQIFHDRDLYANIGESRADFLWSPSRLFASERNIAILKRVYDARNTIYDKCGALGIITNRATDDTGHVAMTESEKKELLEHYNNTYGPSHDKSSTLITDANVDYLKTGANIKELLPFDETLEDAIQIAGLYGLHPVLVPRKDQSTFSNQASAEKAAYTSIIIPLCKRFCNNLTQFLGLKDYYVWCNFDDVDCLQAGRKEEEENKQLVNERCRQQFIDGLISYNDWRAQIHECAKDGDIFNKTRYEMTEEERAFVDTVMSASGVKSAIVSDDDNSESGDNPDTNKEETTQEENGEDGEESDDTDKD